MILFFDTETTGLPKNWKAPVSDGNKWPRMVQLAYLVYDFAGNKIHECNRIIKPEGFTIPVQASKIHRITTENALKVGVHLKSALQEFLLWVEKAEYIVAHNMKFDEKIIGTELYRNKIPDFLSKKKKICTMLSATDFCKISGKYDYKYPTLEELHFKLFNSHFEDAHNAFIDIQVTAKCFWALKDKEIIKISNESSQPKTETIDNIKLDETNVDFNHAVDYIKHTDKLVYLTGKAGTGKTTFLKYLRKIATKNIVVLAPTGVAAINAGGQTIHSFFKIKPSVYVPNDKRLRTKADEGDEDRGIIYDHFKYFKEKLDVIKELELLIIDEISMVRCDLLDVVDRLLRVYRKKENEPFGGVQVLLIGDTFQLPPIANPEEWEILKEHYDSPFFFSSKAIQNNKPIYIELKKIYRQNEKEFIDLLNRVRISRVGQSEMNLLNSKFNPTFTPNSNSNYITLATHNRIVDSINLTKLSELETELKVFEATVTGTFPEDMMPTSNSLQLKEGAQIMFVKNDAGKKYYNGKIAKIKKIEENEIIAEFENKQEITVEKQEWENIRFTWNKEQKRIEEEIIGTFTQFPVKLAWAITVHKSQGLTFEKVIADLGAAFAPGQVYVALSRCTTLDGLVLKTKISSSAITTDPKVLEFALNETPSTLIVGELNAAKADYFYKKSKDEIKANNYEQAFKYFVEAVKYNN